MLPRTNNKSNEEKKNQKPVPKDNNVLAEAREDEKLPSGYPGNEAMNAAFFTNMLRMANEQTGEEFLEGNLDRISSHESEHNINNDNNINNINNDNNILADSGDILNISNSNNNIITNIPQEGMRENNNSQDQINIPPVVQQAVQQAVNPPAQQEEAIQEFYQDPEGPDWDSLDPDNPLNRDMVVEAPKKRRSKKSKKK